MDLSNLVMVKSTVEISQNFVSFSEYMKFIVTRFFGPFLRENAFLKIRFSYRTRAIINRSWMLTVHKGTILRKDLLKKFFLAFPNVVKHIQIAGYDGVYTI